MGRNSRRCAGTFGPALGTATVPGAGHPDRGFFDPRLDIEHQQRRAGSDQKQSAPADDGKQRSEGGRGQDRTHRIPFLQDSGERSAPFLGKSLKRQRGSHAPFAAHGHAEHRAQHEQHLHRRRKRTGQFDYRKTQNVRDQNRAPTVAVGQHPEKQGSKRPERLGEENRPEDVRRLAVEFGGDRLDAEDQEEEIKTVEGPPQEAGDEGMSLVAA